MKRFVNSSVPKVMLLALFMAVFLAVAAPAAGQAAPVEPEVLQQIDTHGEATFWVILKEQADLSQAYNIADWTERGQFVVEQLQKVAEETQPAVLAELTDNKASYQAFWIINAIQVTGDAEVLNELASHPEVARIVADRVYEIPEPVPGTEEPGINVVEWGVQRINAPDVWSQFGVRGEGIVVANIDTGVLFTHSALAAQYRGNEGGTIDHNYNWFDPSNICGNPSLAPCDNNGHGTHTMGTMVGDDGDPGPNQIGVAPHARWIAAKGCESSSCSTTALLASGQWVLAPTDLSGQNPRPDLRPHVVNNSWGSNNGSDTFYQATVQAWVASGMFPSFSNGNAGPSCGTVGAPASYGESYGVGAFDINNNIASFSSRGPSPLSGVGVKPNISAPGVNVRSAWNNGSYNSISGTSMAAPHLSGAVALMWSAAPALVGNIDQTRTILNQTAIDMDDPQCGGTPENNNVWGEGRLDALAAVQQSPIGDTGALEGSVTDAMTGDPVEGARIVATGPIERTTFTDANGFYSFPVLSVGTYDVTASKFGYISETATGVEITVDATTVQDFALQPAPSGSLSGTVSDNSGDPVANATVTILGTPIAPTTTDENGFYSFASVPEGTYDVHAEAGGCNDPQTLSVTISGDTVQDFSLPARSDAYGYYCVLETPNYVEGDTPLSLSGDDRWVAVELPFPFIFYGETHDTVYACTNGYLNFLAGNCTFFNSAIPSTGTPNGAIYPYWDDLYVDASSSMWTKEGGSPPNRSFTIEWRNVRYFGDSSRRVDFSVTLHENSQIETQYRNVADDARERGSSATFGIENQTGTIALQYSYNTAVLNAGETAVRYRLPPNGFIQGTVTDYNDGLPVAGATIRVLQGGEVVRQTTTDGDGFYRTQVLVGDYIVEASASNYQTETANVSVGEDETVEQDFALMTARVEISPTSLQLIVPPDQTRTRYLTLSNTGSLLATWELNESGGGQIQVNGGAETLVPNPDYDPDSATTEGQYLEGTVPTWEPTAPGDVIRSWTPTGLSLAWGVGYDGNVWLSDVPTNDMNHEFTEDGTPTGRSWHASWAGVWPGDMSTSSDANEICQVNVGGDNGIYCWNKNTGDVTRSITGSFPWTSISQRGLAYRPDDDTFYIGGWNQNILYQVRGFSHGTPGEVVNQCSFSGIGISGLAWNPAASIVWVATNSASDPIYQVDPDTCTILGSLPHPSPGFDGAGLEMDTTGNLWMIDQDPNTAYLIESGVPAFTDVPWISEDPTSGSIEPGESQQVSVMVDTTGLAPGIYSATLHFSTNSGRQPNLQVPVLLIVPAYQTLLNAGGDMYVDGSEDTWVPDQAYTEGDWGYLNAGRTGSTRRPIDGTDDQPLYRTLRQDPTEYRFDGLPEGIYEVRLRFAEITNVRPGTRVFDVIAEGEFLLPAHDIAAEVGSYYADEHVYYIPVTDGQLNLRIVHRRGYAPPHVNAIGVTERPDH
ncbi:MAG: carboxypeptidase regulatory-like domain-containing protein [Anaerolineae bacterium]|nr:carboxypeptidase regulatory-like domain-containing protein [Anaerolineae bacterium]